MMQRASKDILGVVAASLLDAIEKSQYIRLYQLAFTMRVQFAALAALWSLFITAFATNNGLTDLVEWDEHSLTINGTRLFVL